MAGFFVRLGGAVVAAAMVIGAGSASAQVLELQIVNGRVTLDAQNVTVSQILERWAALGGVTVVGGDRVQEPLVSVSFVDESEREVLDVLLRNVAGYILVPGAAGGSTNTIERIIILAQSTPPEPRTGRATSAPPAGGSASRQLPQEVPLPVVDLDLDMPAQSGREAPARAASGSEGGSSTPGAARGAITAAPTGSPFGASRPGQIAPAAGVPAAPAPVPNNDPPFRPGRPTVPDDGPREMPIAPSPESN